MLGVREDLEHSKSLSKAYLPLLYQNRLCETSALGFYAGDMNLYRFVGDDPASAVDPSGLQGEKQVETIKGTEVKLDKKIVRLKDSTGKVIVLIDVTLRNRRGRQGEGWIQIQFTADKDIPADTHWLQFVQRVILDKDGKELAVDFPMLRGGKKIWHQTGKRFVDCSGLPDSKIPIYYDALRGSTRRGPRELTIFDKPTFNPRATYSKQIWSFDTFLVSEGKIYYHFQWKQVATLTDGRWVPKYTNIKGEPVNRLPDWARQDKLPGGFFPDENDDPGRPIVYPNPIPGKNR